MSGSVRRGLCAFRVSRVYGDSYDTIIPFPSPSYSQKSPRVKCALVTWKHLVMLPVIYPPPPLPLLLSLSARGVGW